MDADITGDKWRHYWVCLFTEKACLSLCWAMGHYARGHGNLQDDAEEGNCASCVSAVFEVNESESVNLHDIKPKQ